MSHYPVASDPRHVVLACPTCTRKQKPGNLRGPIDGNRSAQYLFTRSWYCVDCCWHQVLVMEDDHAKRADKEAKLRAQRAKRRGIAV